jgi:hypothetical protein
MRHHRFTLPAASLAPFKKSLVAVSHALLACSLLAACGQNSNPLGESGDYSESGSASSGGYSDSYEPSIEHTSQEPISGGLPADEASTSEAPASEAAATETPATETPATETPTAEAPATETPATETPATETPTAEAPATEAPVAEAPAAEAQPVDAAPQIPAGKPLLFSTDMENQDPGCWGDRNGSGYTRTGCGGFNAIGSSGAVLSEGGPSHSGAKSMR